MVIVVFSRTFHMFGRREEKQMSLLSHFNKLFEIGSRLLF